MTTTSKLTLAAALAAGSGFVLSANQALASTTALEETTTPANLDLPVHFVSEEAEQLGVQFSVLEPGLYSPAIQYMVNDILHIQLDTEALDMDTPPRQLQATEGADSVVFNYISSEQATGHSDVYYRVSAVSGTTPNLEISIQFDEWKFDAGKLGGNPVAMTLQMSAPYGLEFSTEVASQLIIDRFAQADSLQVTSTIGDPQNDRNKTLSWDSELREFESGTAANYRVQTVSGFETARQLRLDQGFDVSHAHTRACMINEAPVTTRIQGAFDWLDSLDDKATGLTAKGAVNDGGWANVDRPWHFTDTGDIEFEPTDMGRLDFDFNLADNQQRIPKQTLGATQTIAFEHCDSPANATKKVIERTVNASVAEWQIIGEEITVPYLPYGGNISQTLMLRQSAGHATPVLVEVMAESGVTSTAEGSESTSYTHNLGALYTTTPGQSKAIHDLLEAALIDSGLYDSIDTAVQRFGFRFLLEAPPGSVTLHSSYNVNNDRALVVNSTNL